MKHLTFAESVAYEFGTRNAIRLAVGSWGQSKQVRRHHPMTLEWALDVTGSLVSPSYNIYQVLRIVPGNYAEELRNCGATAQPIVVLNPGLRLNNLLACSCRGARASFS